MHIPLGNCLQRVGVKFGDTRDHIGQGRFWQHHPISIIKETKLVESYQHYPVLEVSKLVFLFLFFFHLYVCVHAHVYICVCVCLFVCCLCRCVNVVCMDAVYMIAYVCEFVICPYIVSAYGQRKVDVYVYVCVISLMIACDGCSNKYPLKVHSLKKSIFTLYSFWLNNTTTTPVGKSAVNSTWYP